LNRNFCDYQAFCIDQLTNDNGINTFCEGLKLDAAKSHESETQDSVSRTILLITVLFEDMVVAMKLHDTALQKTSTRKIATPSMLFNSGYKFGAELLSNEEPILLEIESLKSFEAFCIFGH
jgi:hypothetical protein